MFFGAKGNALEIVISLIMIEREMGNRGSKSNYVF